MIGQFYTNKRHVRVAGPNGLARFEILNDQGNDPLNEIGSILRYDVFIQEELPYVTAREVTQRTLSEIIKSIPGLAPSLIVPLIEQIPGINNKEEVIRNIEQQLGQDNAQVPEIPAQAV